MLLVGFLGAVLLTGTGCVTTNNFDYSGTIIPPVEGVLIDPGHGGEPEEAADRAGERFSGLSRGAKQGYREECYGAISAAGYKEKTATLAVAKRLKSFLEQSGVRAELTRTTDNYTSLDDRVAKALSPDYRNWLFVSIHFNRSSAQQQASNLKSKYKAPRGFEIYVLPEDGERSTMGKRPSPGYITVNTTSQANHLLAESLENNLEKVSGLRSRGIKDAWFVVLRGAPMPSVLIEAGFLSNPDEGKLIATEEYQETLAKAIYDGIQIYRSHSVQFARNTRNATTRVGLRSETE
jgi:N-acetylmuramoyl-L-alanine amidase